MYMYTTLVLVHALQRPCITTSVFNCTTWSTNLCCNDEGGLIHSWAILYENAEVCKAIDDGLTLQLKAIDLPEQLQSYSGGDGAEVAHIAWLVVGDCVVAGRSED